ncbi:hypothetical protein BJ322DRAFT_1116121 [Thelephora terrestris]|uniref:Exocyst complex component EXO84 n=1 Tax=Thelephora terrestris TaxID=56493 RepID=A0A9P6LCH7_9AGAM|nr:hypothetical protein BJ322DRAFT_1116121 [Thelephora terrestris]
MAPTQPTSLRTGKSTGPKLQKQPSTRNIKRKDTDARKSRVDDKIKRRMSMRYADISVPQPTENIPALPSIPAGFKPTHSHTESQGSSRIKREKQQEDARVAENKLLDRQEFDPDVYIKLKLSSSTESELLSLQSQLRNAKADVAAELQRNVFKNYADFMFVSKEINVLENEMLEFKDSLAEWKSMPSLLHIEESTSAADRRRNVRSSVADLRILYANQMQTLHSQIEGAAKYVPTMPGRHIMTEMDGVLALNAATYKVDHGVKFVVLDDAVLVARRRRRRNNTESEKLVAERCWMLGEMLVLDSKDSASMTNVFKIRHGKETHVYRTEAPGDKKSLLATFRSVAEDLAAKRRKEREGEHERRKSLWVSGDRASQAFEKLPSMPDWMAELTQKPGVGTGAQDKTEGDARWVSDFADRLTVAIALREWEEAVSLVEEGESKPSTMQTLNAKLAPLKASLTAGLIHSLSALDNRKTIVVKLVSLLLRLGAGSAARSTLLTARSEVTKKRVRMIRFEGAVEQYINDLAVVVFTGIKHTADWFLASFKENDMASAFIDWAKFQIQDFATMFRKQVYTSDADKKTVEDALTITYTQSKRLLEEFGLDFRFLLQQLLTEKPKETPRPRPIPARIDPELIISPPTIAPSSTPVRSRSPAAPTRQRTNDSENVSTPTDMEPSRSSTPSNSTIDALLSESGISSLSSPIPRKAAPRHNALDLLRAKSNASLRESAVAIANSQAIARQTPPPRSRDRPPSNSVHRPPPVAIPPRTGMI